VRSATAKNATAPTRETKPVASMPELTTAHDWWRP
jgi:hypothetical protein